MFMEKGTPHCRLAVVSACIDSGQFWATATAYNGACDLGINDLAAMCFVVLALKPTDFYKSMTTHADHRVRQDVYNTTTTHGDEVYH